MEKASEQLARGCGPEGGNLLCVVLMASCGFHGTGDVDAEVHVIMCSVLHL